MAKTPVVTKKQIVAINREIQLGHHIPDILVNEISKLESVQYKEELREFANAYIRKHFIDIAEEYELVKDTINKLLERFLPQNVSEVIEREMRATLAGQILDTKVREAFIHPFQVFLVGSIVIDNFYEDFKHWYSETLCADVKSCIESSWLLASILHDAGKISNIIKRTYEYDIGQPGTKIKYEDDYIGLISSFHKLRIQENDASAWNPECERDNRLEQIMQQSSDRWGHGVKSAVLMLKNISGSPANVNQRDVVAGFSIMVHDKDVWPQLHQGNYLPLRMDLFPLSCLLLQLDAAKSGEEIALLTVV